MASSPLNDSVWYLNDMTWTSMIQAHTHTKLTFSLRAYVLPDLGSLKVMFPRIASRRLICPSRLLCL